MSQGWHRHGWLSFGAVGALALTLLCAINVVHASSLQAALNREYALTQARVLLSQALATPLAELRPVAEQLLHRELGFAYLGVRDRDGQLVTKVGADAAGAAFLTPGPSPGLRSAIYRLTAQTGSIPLDFQDHRVGSLDYAISATLADSVHERAVDRLRLTGWLGLAISLPLLAGFVLALRQRGRADAAVLRERLAAAPARSAADAGDAPPLRTATALLDVAGLGALAVDRNGCVRQINATGSQLTGWTEAAARGQRVYSVFHALDDGGAPGLSAAERALREGHDVAPATAGLRARDGAVRPIEMSAALLRTPDGAVDGAVMLFRDTSAQAAQAGELQRQARLSQGVIDHLDEGLLTTDPAGVVRFANARILRMFGYSRDELEQMTVTKLMPVPFLNTPGIRLTDYIAARGAGKLPKVVGWRKDATTFPVELLVQTMNVDGDDGLVVIVRDITERLRGDSLASRLGRLLDSAAEEIYILDAQTLRFLEVNRSARRNLGYRADELARMTLPEISRGIEPAIIERLLSRLRGGETEQLGYRARHRRGDGSEYEVDVRLNFSRDEEPPAFMAIVTDLSSRPGHS